MEFHTVRNEPGRLVLTAKQWRHETGNKKISDMNSDYDTLGWLEDLKFM